MEHLLHEEILEYLEVFNYFGQDRNGRISTKQLRQAMRMLGLNPTDNEIQALVNEKEYDGDGTIVFPEFIKMMEDHKKPEDRDDLLMAFRVFDPGNKGFVEVKELKKAFLRLKDIPKKKIDEIVETANLQEDRHIYFEEFSRLLVPLINRELDIVLM